MIKWIEALVPENTNNCIFVHVNSFIEMLPFCSSTLVSENKFKIIVLMYLKITICEVVQKLVSFANKLELNWSIVHSFQKANTTRIQFYHLPYLCQQMGTIYPYITDKRSLSKAIFCYSFFTLLELFCKIY